MNNTLKKIRQRVIYVVMYAFCTGVVLAFTFAKYRQSPTNFDGGYILISGVLLFGTIFHSWIIWAKIKELEQPGS